MKGIGIGVDAGGSQADKAIAELHWQFNQALKQFCNGDYCPAVETYGVVLRVSGDVADFKFDGLDALRRSKKKRLITIDIGIPEWRWKSMSDMELREWLAEQVRGALQAFADRLKKDGEQIDEERLFADYARAVDTFLGHPGIEWIENGK